MEHPASADNRFVKTGIRGLDDVLGGGFAPNRMHLVEGNPGSGKTTLALRFLMEGRDRGERVLYVTLSETVEELRSAADSHGWDLAGIDLIELVPNEESLDREAEYTMFDPAEVELPEVLKVILSEVERIAPSRIVIDSLSELRLLAQTSLRYRRYVLALKQFFMGRKTTVLLLNDQSASDLEVQLQSIAHGVLVLEQLAPEYGAERRRLRVVKLRAAAYRGGYHDFRIVRGGLEVYPRLVAAEHRQEFTQSQAQSGIQSLDRLLGGGLEYGTSTLVMGPAGCGKSTVTAQYAAHTASQGTNVAVFLFDESVATWSIRTRGIGTDVRPLLESGALAVQQIDPAEMSPGEFIVLVRRAVEAHNAQMIVIDSLNGYLNAMPEERFLLIHLHELLTYLGQQGVATLLILGQHGLIGQHMQTPVDVSYLADSIILLRYFEMSGEVRHAISVLKKRSGHHDGSIRELTMSGDGLAVGEPMRGFRGILTGVPMLLGTEQLRKDSDDDLTR
ncbi:MAG TPA: ATPase domain-containing protein [Herpetosiphonaceae bacterium]|nr:ATPase domain-containing protein [Herpetosiphonaceae bacterium]